jgi:hypothetical protein
VTPALFVEFGFEALRQPRLDIFIARIAPCARRASAAAVAGAPAFERPVRMVLTDPAAIVANGALHRSRASFRQFRAYPKAISLSIK